MQIKEVTFVPLDAALRRVYQAIPTEMMSEDDARELAVDAMQHLAVRYTYQERIAFRRVTNHRAQLPPGLKFIDQVMFLDTTEDVSLDPIEVWIQGTGDDTTSSSYHDYLMDSRQSGYLWQPLQASTTGWSLSVHCNDSININCPSCNHTYRVEPNGCVTTSFSSGYLAILYLSHPKNENNEFLIPDDEDYIEAIKDYVMMAFNERRWNQHVEGSYQRYIHYQRKWVISGARVKGNFMMPSSDGLENLRRQLQRVGEHNETWGKGFHNLSSQESVSFNNDFTSASSYLL